MTSRPEIWLHGGTVTEVEMILHYVWCNGEILSVLTQNGMAKSGSLGVSIDSVPVVVVDTVAAKDQQGKFSSFGSDSTREFCFIRPCEHRVL